MAWQATHVMPALAVGCATPVKVGVVKGAGKEWYGVVASRAKPRGTNVSIPRHGHLAGIAY
ncbi:MAG: hypothetical protein CM1200mP9_09770 [Gammaproteobacteria bacterium]|nr:MAG: hypothetical protein CM1200mP9_09770 [Gammaproteobacteria bacterium]